MPMNDVQDNGRVVIVGAGPVGLWLACELRLAGTPAVVLEGNRTPTRHSKALGLHPRTVEVLAMRGAEEPFLAEGMRVPAWHFGMLPHRLDFRALDTAFPFMLAIPQTRTEALLSQRAAGLGVEIHRGHTVTALSQNSEAVTLEVHGPDGTYLDTASYVVGCDGAGSTVRKASGIDFPGSDAHYHGFLGDVTLDRPPAQPGTTYHTEQGALVVAPIPGGRFRVTGFDPAHQEPDAELTMAELRAVTERVTGTDFGMRDPVWLSRFGNATRVASTYRAGRVLVAGDAAHMHFPAGGVGLNVGIQDAMNLGWKLAACLQGRAGDDLLDSYHLERHPVGTALSELTLAQTELITTTSAEGMALRAWLSDTIARQPAFSRALAVRLTALDVAYPPASPGAHPLTGARFPDMAEYLYDGRAALLNFGDRPLAETARRAAASGVRLQHAAPPAADGWSEVGAIMLRPDGHVWWAGDRGAGLDAKAAAAIADARVRF
ncbi:FAD-dependent monooxygenase [Amycolatopsis sp. NBC_00345]|uniref:FAD-dependent monooxygenase n=1 Tax=Amycolatopsis sp. NBC_00345 TaxID=2975955 RepID=UPI002E254126